MPNNGDTSNYTSVFRLTPLGDPQRKVIKRNRQVVSCVPCRTRKLKCDRQHPCTSCVKRSDAVSCRFYGPAGAAGAASAGSPMSSVPRKQMQIRLQQLEHLVNGLNTEPGSNGSASKDPTGEPPPAASASSRDEAASPGQSSAQEQLGGGGNNVRYAGVTNYAAVLECIRNLQDIVDEEAPDCLSASSQNLSRPGSQHGAQEGPRQQQRQQQQQQQQQHVSAQAHDLATPLTSQQIMNHLPTRSECDNVLTFYFQQIYIIPMAIHSGGFQRAYESFWKQPEGTSLLWISTLFSVLSTAVFQQASKAAGCEGLGAAAIQDPEARQKIELYSSMAYRCLVSGDHLLGKPYSVEAALLFVTHLVMQKRDTDPTCWHTFGTAIRLAQRMGYHRDPSYLNRNCNMKISPFDAEMRRRSWFTLEHLDLTFGFLLGIPPVVHGDDVDTHLPSNLNDEEFNENSPLLPRSRPASDFTRALPYIFYSRQVQVLRRIFRQDIAVAHPSYAEVMSLDADLRSLYDDMPPNLRYKPIHESSFADAPDMITRRMIIEIMHLKGMCMLHRRYLTLGRENAVYDRSRDTCREASLKLLDLHAEFDGQSRDGGRLYEKRYTITNAGFHVFLLAAMCLCLDLMASSVNRTQPFHARAVSSLERARTIWSRTAQVSKESAHATKVLKTILTKISPPDKPSTQPPAPASSTKSAHSTTLSEQSDTPGPSWSAVNNKESSTGTAGRRDLSIAWDFGMDIFDSAGTKKPESDDPIDMAVNGDIDWNQLDSLLFNRENTGVTIAAPSVPPAAEENPREGWPYIAHGDRTTRENWPFPQYDHVDASPGSGTASFRTWARGGTTLGGFGFP